MIHDASFSKVTIEQKTPAKCILKLFAYNKWATAKQYKTGY